MAESSTLDKKIVRDYLKVTDKFLEEHASVIREKLDNAAKEAVGERGAEFAVNQCLHLAGSLVLHCTSLDLSHALDKVRQVQAFFGKDPTTVLTIAMLHHLLQLDVLAPTDKDRKNREALLDQFANIDWLLGTPAVEVLGIGERGKRKDHT
jgi:hypothetical protein